MKEAALETELKVAHQPSSVEASSCFFHYPQPAQQGKFQWGQAALGNKIGSFLLYEGTVPFIVSSDLIKKPRTREVHLCQRSVFHVHPAQSHLFHVPNPVLGCAAVAAIQCYQHCCLGCLMGPQDNHSPDVKPAWICQGSLAKVQHSWNMTILTASQDHPGSESSSVTPAHWWEAVLYCRVPCCSSPCLGKVKVLITGQRKQISQWKVSGRANNLFSFAFIVFGDNFHPKANDESTESEFYHGNHFASLTTTFAISESCNAKAV